MAKDQEREITQEVAAGEEQAVEQEAPSAEPAEAASDVSTEEQKS